MRKELALSLLLLSLVVISTLTPPASATDYTKVGVKVGDTAEYNYSSPEGNGLLRIQVLQITGTNVTLNIKIRFNGSDTVSETVVTGNLSATINRIYLHLVASNLSQGDSVMPGFQLLTIQDTTTMSIAGSNRIVNHASYSLIMTGLNESYIFDAYWDKATGLGVRSNITFTDMFAAMQGVQAGSYTMNLTSTTAFGIGNNIDPIVLLIAAGGATILIVSVAITAALTQKKHKTTASK